MKIASISYVVVALTTLISPVFSQSAGFYKNPKGLFSKRPSATKSIQNLKRFGPIGLSIDLVQPAFTMQVADVEEGSPAAATGQFKKGQIIESVNGEGLKDIDPRMQMARWISAAEASDGKVIFKIKGLDEPVLVQLPVMGAYSKTWPIDCAKSDKIVRGLADYLSQPGSNRGISDIGMMFLISTGNDKDTKVVGEWARNYKPSNFAWFLGFAGIPLCEYYLRTGDQEVLPVIQEAVAKAVEGEYNGGWAGRGGVPKVTYGMGHLNAAGTGVVAFLMLAKECGADVPDHTLHRALRHFYRYAGRGGNPYGDGRPECGFVDNGKNGYLALAMAAAAALTPEKNSVYAKARDVSAITGFYTTSFMLHGHTGGGIGEIWRSASMGLMKDKSPNHYREFMDNRVWHYELSRRYDGSFGILEGGGYDDLRWGCAYGLAYTVPRKTLRIFGAPPTKYSKPYKLPSQPWGVKADNEFLSLKAVPMPDGSQQDHSKETLADSASMPFLRAIHGKKAVSDDDLRRFIHHQDAVIRRIAAAKVIGVNRGYIGWLAPGGNVRPALMMELLQSKSARVRRAMFAAIDNVITREGKSELLTREVFELAVASVKDPKESWWVKDAALHVMAHGSADQIQPHTDLLLSYLKIDEWWLQQAAMKALAPVSADPRSYQKVLPAIAELMRNNQRAALSLGLMPSISSHIRKGSPEVQALAVKVLKHAYTGYAGVDTAPGGQDISSTVDAHLERIAGSLADVPGGLDVLYEIARERYPNQILPYKEFFLKADPKQFGPKLKKAITPIIIDELIPEYVGRNRKDLQKLAAREVQSTQPGGSRDDIDGLVALYDRAGQKDYRWKEFLNLRQAEWEYHSFDPVPSEQAPWDYLVTRFRDVTLPKGMEKWADPAFDSAKAGWKVGKAPFGQFNGKLPVGVLSKCSEACVGPICYGSAEVNTLWEKEVLLMRGTYKVPPLKQGHRYRVVVNQRVHVGNGGGYAIFINGKQLIKQPKCIGRGGGEKANGAFITQAFLDEFKGGEITIAVKSFLRFNDKYKSKPTEKIARGRISVHLDEQKLPPMGYDLIRKSAQVVAMTTSEWERAVQKEEGDEVNPESFKFDWDGKWQPNEKVMGNWRVVATIQNVASFDPVKNKSAKKSFIRQIQIKRGGDTNNAMILWTGDHLLNLETYEAHKMLVRNVGGKNYLFVEAGKFSKKPRSKYDPIWVVLTATK
ncbi:MAG: hypothetical protein KJO21_09605 [Verrucomicrobiae bacterium]|nr:hypothetical protein [Verrucomicrobiae bacterium]NNJ42395.1 hypothetical protein [Akkermansiaceae bacterium]